MSTKIDLLKQIADKLGITDIEQLYYSTENDLLFAILQGINGIGKDVDYNNLKNKPIENLIGTMEDPVELYNLQSGFYSITGYIKQDIDGDSVLINHPMPFTVFRDDNIKFAFSGHLVKGYALHENIWQTVLTDTLVFNGEIEGLRSDLLAKINYIQESFVKLQDIKAQIVNSDIAFKNGRKLLFEKQDGTHSVGMFMGEYGLSLIDIPIGHNLRGKTVLFQNTNLNVVAPSEEAVIDIVDNDGNFFYISHEAEGGISIQNVGDVTVNMYTPSDGWLRDSFTFPDDRDYIVESKTNLYSHIGNNWGFDYTKYDSSEQLEIGSESEHINLNTKDYVSIDTPEGTKRFQFQETLSRSQFIALPKLASYTEYLIYEDED